MTHRLEIVAILSSFLVFGRLPLSAEEANAPLPLDTLLEIRSVVADETPQWAPDGSRILFASGSSLMTVRAEGGSIRRLPMDLSEAGHFLASHMPRWSPTGEWVAYVSDRTGTPEIWLWSAKDGRERALTHHGARINAFSWAPDGKWIAFSGDRYGSYDIWKVSVPRGEAERVTSHERYEVFPSWTPDSKEILYVRLDERWIDHQVIVVQADGENARVMLEDREFFDYRAGGTFGFPLVSPDGRSFLYPSLRSGWINYWIAPLEGGESRPIAPAQADQTEATWSPDGRSLAFIENHNGTHELRLVDPAGGSSATLMAPETGVVAEPAWSPDGEHISFTLEDFNRPKDLYVVSVESKEIRQLTFSMPEGNLEEQLLIPEKITYPSSDGIEIAAYLYKPQNLAPDDRLPAIVWTHGGPTSQYNDTFNRNAQFFAQRGYAVLLPNIRGSSGYGHRFEKLNNGCWGHCDLEDVIAGVEYLKTLSYVEPDKMGTTGSSYGGFMTCSAIVFAPGVFQAAVAASGYCNRVSFVEEGEHRHIQQLAYELGSFEENQELYYRNSPFFFVKNIRTPTFVLHGEGRYPGSPQMREFARMMQKEYKTFRYKAYPGENYYVRGKANTWAMLTDMLRFFDFYLKDKDLELPGVGHIEELTPGSK